MTKKLVKYQQVLLFIGIGIVLWSAILLQLFANETPCPRCWEVRGVYLIILELLMLSLLIGFRDVISIGLVILFIVLGNWITVQQIITHTIHLTEGAIYKTGYGAYADFLSISLPVWNMLIANLAIIYLFIMQYLNARLHVGEYVCQTRWSMVLVVIWGLAPILANFILLMNKL